MNKYICLKSSHVNTKETLRLPKKGKFVTRCGFCNSKAFNKVPETFTGSRIIKLASEVKTRQCRIIWTPLALDKLTQLRVLNVSYIECGELLGVNTKVVRRAVLTHKLQPAIDLARKIKINEVML